DGGVAHGGLHRVGAGRSEGDDVFTAGGGADRLRQGGRQLGRRGPDAALGHERDVRVEVRPRHTDEGGVVVAEQGGAEPADQVEHSGAVGADQVVAVGAGVDHIEVAGAQ